MPPRRLRSPVVPWKGSLPLPIGSHRPTKWPIPAEARRCAPQLGARRPTLDGGTTSTCSAPGSSVLTASFCWRNGQQRCALAEASAHRRQALARAPAAAAALPWRRRKDLLPWHNSARRQSTGRPTPLAPWVPVHSQRHQLTGKLPPLAPVGARHSQMPQPTERPTFLAQQCPSSVNGKTYSLGTMGARSLSEASVDGETHSLGTSWCPSTLRCLSRRKDLLS